MITSRCTLAMRDASIDALTTELTAKERILQEKVNHGDFLLLHNYCSLMYCRKEENLQMLIKGYYNLRYIN